MLGAIIGDIVGSRFEFDNYKFKDFELFTKDCFITDDSIMTLAIAKAIMETSKYFDKPLNNIQFNEDFLFNLERLTINYMQNIGRCYPNCGFGGMFSKWIFSDNPQPYNSFGNGAAMRISPVGFVAKTIKEVKLLSESMTKITHNHIEGLKGAEATAMSIFLAKIGYSKNEIFEYIHNNYYSLDFTIEDIRDSYEFNETCQDTVPQSIMAFLESNSFEDAIRNSISLGGDSDTIAAIAGSIAEYYYEIPKEIELKALSYLDDFLLDIYNEWCEFIID